MLHFVFDEMGRTCGGLICVKLKMKSDEKEGKGFPPHISKVIAKIRGFGGVILEVLAKNHHSVLF